MTTKVQASAPAGSRMPGIALDGAMVETATLQSGQTFMPSGQVDLPVAPVADKSRLGTRDPMSPPTSTTDGRSMIATGFPEFVDLMPSLGAGIG